MGGQRGQRGQTRAERGRRRRRGFGEDQDGALAAGVRLLAVLGHVESHPFLAARRPQRRQRSDGLEQRERGGAAVGAGGEHGGGLAAELRRIAGQEAVPAAPDGARQHSGQQRADHAPAAVRGGDAGGAVGAGGGGAEGGGRARD